MRDLIIRTFVLLAAAASISAIFVNTTTNNSGAMNVNTEENPLLAKWEGPYGGIPPFDRVTKTGGLATWSDDPICGV